MQNKSLINVCSKKDAAWWQSALFQSVCKYFLLGSFVAFFGWAFETVSFAVLNIADDRGFLTSPFCYLYGSSVLLVYFLLGTPLGGKTSKLQTLFKGKKPSRARTFFLSLLQIILYFFAVSGIATLIELITGLVFVRWLNIPLWSYEYYDHTYLDVVCLDFSLLWGALITLGMGTLWHLFVWLEGKLSPRTRAVSAILLFLLVSADFVFNCIYFLRTGIRFNVF